MSFAACVSLRAPPQACLPSPACGPQLWSHAQAQPQIRRGFAAEAGSADDDAEEERDIGSPKVRALVEEIANMSLLDVSDLTVLLQKRLKISPGMMGAPMGYSSGGGAPAAGAAAAPAAEAPKVEEKTEFDVKLASFDPAAKIKVIKEVRAITELGLKEAKELVEKAPIVIKSGMKKEEAEALKLKLEAAGGKIELE